MAVIRKDALSFKCGNFAKRYPDHEANDLLREAEGLIEDMESELEELRAARQPVGEPVAWEVRRSDGSPLACWEACTQDAFEATKRTGRYLGYENGPLCEVRALIAATPVQGIDLMQLRTLLNDVVDDRGSYWKPAKEMLDRLDSQRDAAPGV